MILRPLRSVLSLAAVAALLALVVAPTSPVHAEQADLEGAWSGSGKIVFPSGATENARCRARFSKQSANSFGMSAVCATASARVVQNARLERTVGNRFAGEFSNPDYGIIGRIKITVRGSNMSADLEGGGGSAEFSLSR